MPKIDIKAMIKDLKKNELTELISVAQEVLSTLFNSSEIRDNVKETILKLKNKGYKIYIITSRSKEYHKDSYQISYDWLVKNEIYFDELIVNVNDKLKMLF